MKYSLLQLGAGGPLLVFKVSGKLQDTFYQICNLPDTLNTNNGPPAPNCNKEYFIQLVRNNTTVLDCDLNWNLLLYKEAYYIKRLIPSLNNGLKSSRELCLFS